MFGKLVSVFFEWMKVNTLRHLKNDFVKPVFLFFYRVYAVLVFVVFMLALLPLMLVAALLGVNVGGTIIFFLIRVWAHIWFPLCGITHKNSGARPAKGEGPFIHVANHDSYMDAPITMLSLRGQFRSLGKHDIQRIPFFGWIYKYGVILVDRNDKDNRAKSVRVLKRVLERRFSIMIFPEGAFNYTAETLARFYDGAFRIAIETQTPIVPMIYVGATDRLPRDSFFKLTPGKTETVFLPAVSIKEYSLDDVALLREKVKAMMAEEIVKQKNK